jgi:hypothetical protein
VVEKEFEHYQYEKFAIDVTRGKAVTPAFGKKPTSSEINLLGIEFAVSGS